jgi:F-type H+-transporting ATPase subunit gamma
MAGGIRAIKDRIRSVANTSKVTRAMELVAASKMRRATNRALQSRPYADRMTSVLNEIADALGSTQGESAHPLLTTRPVSNVVYIHITADRGLAGGLSANMNRAGASFLLEHQPNVDSMTVIPLGRKGKDFFSRAGMVMEDWPSLGDFPDFSDVKPIAASVIEQFQKGEIDQVFVGFSRFINAAIQRPETVQVLPIDPPADEEGAEQTLSGDMLFEPSPVELLDTLLPRYVEMQLYAAVLEARASEQSARMVAMRQATDAANDMVDSLTLEYNKARQEGITGELLDIVGGTAALEG